MWYRPSHRRNPGKGAYLSNSAELWDVLERYSRFLITSHVRPDLDAVGSELALALFIERLNKDSRVVNEGPLPRAFGFLPGRERVLAYPEGMEFDYDVIVCLDAPDLARTGKVGTEARDVPVVIVDHHPYSSAADFTIVDHSSSSTGEILFRVMSYRKDLIDSRIATCLFAAILTDTGRFTYSNAGRRTFEAAAELVSLGADPHFVSESYYENVTDGQMHLMGLAASRMRRAGNGAIAYTTLSSEDFVKTGAGPEAAQEFAELARSLEGALVGVLLRDVGGKIKVSLRSKGSVDVKAFAERYGGGGHHRAAGFLLELPLAQAEIEVIRGLEDYLK